MPFHPIPPRPILRLSFLQYFAIKTLYVFLCLSLACYRCHPSHLLSFKNSKHIWFSLGYVQPVHMADNLAAIMCQMSGNFGSLNFLKSYGPVQACKGIASWTKYLVGSGNYSTVINGALSSLLLLPHISKYFPQHCFLTHHSLFFPYCEIPSSTPTHTKNQQAKYNSSCLTF